MSAVATIQPQAAHPILHLVSMVERLAVDDRVDVEKMERLVALQERMMARQAEADFNVAMTDCQSQMGRISADATNSQTKSRYATYGKLDSVLRPIYTSHGFSLSFSDADSPKAEHVRVLCIVRHRSGHKESHYKDMPADGKGAKGGDVMTKTHAAGAAQQYGMRYLLKGIFNVAIGEDDNDGNAPEGATQYISADQVTELRDLAKDARANVPQFLKWIGAESFDVMPKGLYQKAKQALNDKKDGKL